jgi:cytochrome c
MNKFNLLILIGIFTLATNSATAMSNDEGVALAKKSGCFACHSIERKIVGPAWHDVSERYKGDSGARATLIEKVKKGGKGNWTEVTKGVPMPPYSPRVSDADIEKLVDFVLSLEK